jgi:flagellar biosynthesis/type III secretory pathway chaperone
MVGGHVQNVIKILNSQYNYYKDLLELSKTKKSIIIEGKVKELDKIIKLEQNMVFDIGQLERAREQETAQICKLIGLNIDTASLSEISSKLEPKYQQEISKLQGLLSDTLKNLKAANEINGELIKQSLEYIDYSINIITSANSTTGSLYEDITDKNKGASTKKRIFDTKV